MPALIQWQWQVTKPPRPAAPYLSVSPPVKLCGLHLVIVFSYFTDLCLAAPPPYRNLIWLQSNQGDAILPGLSLVSTQQTSSTISRTYLLQVVCSCHRQLGWMPRSPCRPGRHSVGGRTNNQTKTDAAVCTLQSALHPGLILGYITMQQHQVWRKCNTCYCLAQNSRH